MKGKQASRAPKERINIVYRPAARPNEAVELPLKMLVLADLLGKPEDVDLDDRKTISIDKDNFQDVVKELDLGVDLAVPNKLTNEPGDEMSVSLKFDHMRDFRPHGIAVQVPELKKLLELREALSALKSPLGNKKEFRQRIKAMISEPGQRAQLLKELGLEEEG